MNKFLRTLGYSSLTHGVKALLVALVCAVALIGCEGDTTNPTYNTYTTAPTSTLGTLNVNVYPASADVVVTGPGSYTKSFTGNQFIFDLTPGQYTATAAAPGFLDGASTMNIVANHNSIISLALQPKPIITEAPRAVYRDENGALIPLDTTNMQSGKFLFYAWLQDLPTGIITTTLTSTVTSTGFPDPGMPLLTEQRESAPSFTQNLAGAWVGFIDSKGIVRPVIGADVRWEIDQQYAARINSTQFGTSDDNRSALNYGVFDDQADTRTNNSRLAAERFPLVASEYPLYNLSGISAPFTDGFTWVTLFSPDATAASRVVAVATINGEEIGKQILYKNFAPAPKIEITKTIDTDILNLDVGDTVTWTVTVKNTGTGDATRVDLNDLLVSGPSGSYTLGPLPAGCVATADPDIFECTIGPLAAPGGVPPAPNTQFMGNAWNFAVLANATVTNTGSSVVNGNVGVSAGTAVTGFPPGIVLNGTIHNNDAAAVAAQTALTAAYVDLMARACDGANDTQPLTGTITPGVYCYSSAMALSGPVVLDAQGDPTAVFVFKNTDSTLNAPAGTSVSLINGANSCNVYWAVGSSATIQAGVPFVGNILAQASITGVTGASFSGRLLARVGSVTLDTNVVNAPQNCVAAPASTEILTFTGIVTAPGTYCNEIQVALYSDGTSTWTPVDINDQACFTAVSANLSIVKDFVADDNATSLGDARTVSANVPAKMRVRVINAGTGPAAGVVVNDLLTSGALANYRIVSATSTTNVNGGFDQTIGDLAAGASTTVFLTVAASADGVYCDTATVSDTGGPVDSDVACLTVATPNLTITKTDAPQNVIPGATYTSTIIVNNTGSADAKNVVISDLLGNLNINADGTSNTNPSVQAIYVSSSLNGAGGTLANSVVTANSVATLVSGGTMTFTVVSRMPLGTIAGQYCDTATVTSSNAVTRQDTDCVTVPAFAALQTQLIDLADPISRGSNATFFSTLYVEALSNQGVNNNTLRYSFGVADPAAVGSAAGLFTIVSTKVYRDTAPVRDPITGMVVSDTANASAVLLTLGTDYTVDDSNAGYQVLNLTGTGTLNPNTAFYVVHVVLVPSGTPVQLYTTGYIWNSNTLVVGTLNMASASEPTTVY